MFLPWPTAISRRPPTSSTKSTSRAAPSRRCSHREGSFTIGVSAYNPDRGLLYVPDAASNAVIELTEDTGGFTETGSVQIAPGLGLPPTQVYSLN